MGIPRNLQYIDAAVPMALPGRSVDAIGDRIKNLSESEQSVYLELLDKIAKREDEIAIARWMHDASANTTRDCLVQDFIVFLIHFAEVHRPTIAEKITVFLDQQLRHVTRVGVSRCTFSACQSVPAYSVLCGIDDEAAVCQGHYHAAATGRLTDVEWLEFIVKHGVDRITSRDQYQKALPRLWRCCVSSSVSKTPTRHVLCLALADLLIRDVFESDVDQIFDAALAELNRRNGWIDHLFAMAKGARQRSVREAMYRLAERSLEHREEDNYGWMGLAADGLDAENVVDLLCAWNEVEHVDDLIEREWSQQYPDSLWLARRALARHMSPDQRLTYARRLFARFDTYHNPSSWCAMLLPLPIDEVCTIVDSHLNNLFAGLLVDNESRCLLYELASALCIKHVSESVLHSWITTGTHWQALLAVRCILCFMHIDPDGRLINSQVPYRRVSREILMQIEQIVGRIGGPESFISHMRMMCDMIREAMQ